MEEINRMAFPEDVFIKRQFIYLGEIAHELNNFPGKYLGSENNEYPDAKGSIKRADIVYSVELNDGTINIINVEDETSSVNRKTLEKSYKYKTSIYYKNSLPVISIITTTIPYDKCLKELWISQTDLFKPIIKSYPRKDGWKKLNKMLDKARNGKKFSNIEGLELINMPRYCSENQEDAVRLICEELPDLKVEDQSVKDELIYGMQCMIHKHIKEDEEVIELEERIGLNQIVKNRSPVLNGMRREGWLKGHDDGLKEGVEIGIEKGIEKGREEGREEGIKHTLTELANDPDNDYDIEKLARKLGCKIEKKPDKK